MMTRFIHSAMSFPETSAPLPARRKSRWGCLGCLWQVTLALLFGCVVMLAVSWLLYPWAFYMGGSFHFLPYWQGWAKMHAKSGDYALMVRLVPTSRGSRMYAGSHVTGNAWLCTPRGELFRMHLGGGMRPYLKRSSDGEAIHLYMYNWPWYAPFTGDHRPGLDFRGRWHNPNLVGDDHGSISNEFNADASVYRGGDRSRPYSTETVPVTFVPGTYSDFQSACASLRR